jgi:hypothetical protein
MGSAASSTRPIALPMHCAYCHGAVTLQMSDWRQAMSLPPDDRPLRTAVWRCPYCQQMDSGGFPGRLAWVRKGHDPNQTV